MQVSYILNHGNDGSPQRHQRSVPRDASVSSFTTLPTLEPRWSPDHPNSSPTPPATRISDLVKSHPYSNHVVISPQFVQYQGGKLHRHRNRDPHRHKHRDAQHKFHPPPTPKFQDMACTDDDASQPATETKMTRHSNTPYTLEMLDFLHYCRETLRQPWKDILENFRLQFPMRSNPSEQGIQGRYYRDQIRVLKDPKTGNYCVSREKAPLAARVPAESDSQAKEGDQWEVRKVKIRDRSIEGIKELGLKFELIYLGVHRTLTRDTGVEKDLMTSLASSYASDYQIQRQIESLAVDCQTESDLSATRDGKAVGSGAERLLGYRWSVIRDIDRERARRISM